MTIPSAVSPPLSCASQLVRLSRTEQSLVTKQPCTTYGSLSKGDANEIEKRSPSFSWRNELERSRPGPFFPTEIQMNPVKQRSWHLELVRTDYSTTYIQYGVNGREECNRRGADKSSRRHPNWTSRISYIRFPNILHMTAHRIPRN